MKTVYLLLLVCVACASAAPRIIGGFPASINQYPSNVVMLQDWAGTGRFLQSCGGTIINTRHILTAAHCFVTIHQPERWRARVGSSFASSGGTVHSIWVVINHPRYNQIAFRDSDISIVRTTTTIIYIANTVQPASFAGPNYQIADNEVVWITGWGPTRFNNYQTAEQLHDTSVWTINQRVCGQRHNSGSFRQITDNMICVGWLDVGLRDQCTTDAGSPVYHNGVVVGLYSYSSCGSPRHPSVNTRISRFTDWIAENV